MTTEQTSIVNQESDGDDTYLFGRDDGVLTIADTAGDDRIQFGDGITASDLVFEVVGNDLVIGLLPEGTDRGGELPAASSLSDRITI